MISGQQIKRLRSNKIISDKNEPTQIPQKYLRSERASSDGKKIITDQKEPAQFTQNHHKLNRSSSSQKESSQIK